MTRPARLHLIADENNLHPPLEDEIRLLLKRRREALEALGWADAELLPLRKRYAAERGEYLLPSLPRLYRELLGQ